MYSEEQEADSERETETALVHDCSAAYPFQKGLSILGLNVIHRGSVTEDENREATGYRGYCHMRCSVERWPRICWQEYLAKRAAFVSSWFD